MGKNNSNSENNAGGEKNGSITLILTVDMHCEGCSKKVIDSLKGFHGVEEVKGDFSSNKLTVVGKVDPEKIRDRVESKTKKKVVLVSALPKKDKKPDEEKQPEEPAATTVLLKVRLDCDGCIQKIRRIISKTKGLELLAVDSQKDLITLKGTIDFKVFVTNLRDRMKREIEILPTVKNEDKEKDKQGKKKGEEKKENQGQKKSKEKDKESQKKGEEKKENQGQKKSKENDKQSQKKGKQVGDEKKNEEGVSENKFVVEPNKMEHWGYGYDGPIEYVHAPQYFSDENPNACSVM